jgi:hypothetical protein
VIILSFENHDFDEDLLFAVEHFTSTFPDPSFVIGNEIIVSGRNPGFVILGSDGKERMQTQSPSLRVSENITTHGADKRCN